MILRIFEGNTFWVLPSGGSWQEKKPGTRQAFSVLSTYYQNISLHR
jgi:hypothetical protein